MPTPLKFMFARSQTICFRNKQDTHIVFGRQDRRSLFCPRDTDPEVLPGLDAGVLTRIAANDPITVADDFAGA